MNPTMYFLKIYYDQIYFIQEIKGKLNITTIMYYSRKKSNNYLNEYREKELRVFIIIKRKCLEDEQKEISQLNKHFIIIIITSSATTTTTSTTTTITMCI